MHTRLKKTLAVLHELRAFGLGGRGYTLISPYKKQFPKARRYHHPRFKRLEKLDDAARLRGRIYGRS